MKLSLSKRVISAVMISALIGSSAAFISSFMLLRGFERQAQQDVQKFSHAAQELMDVQRERCRETAFQFASRPDVIEAVKQGDGESLRKIAKAFLASGAVNVLTVAGPDGKVLARGHSDKAGDSVLGQVNVKKALSGEASAGIEEGTVVKFSMRAGQPIRSGNSVVGSVTAGIDLSGDTRFVDRVKEVLGVECTLFHGDTRVSTTIAREGKRAVGTRMDNPAVIETVLRQGKTFQAVNRILDREYNTTYWPIRDLEGKILGMFFIGKERDVVVQAREEMILTVALVVAGVIGLMALAAFFIARSIAGPIQRVSGGLAESTGRVASVSSQVSGTSKMLSDGASEQAAAIEETSSSLEEMASMTKHNAENASQADGLMKQVAQLVGEANGSMEKLSGSMQEIQKASEETQKIVKTIDEIAFQTNLLALNAAVEAARAGEAGAGFAVVADEVRNLAMRAADSARNTAALIESTVNKVKGGAGLMNETRESFARVVQSAGKVADLLAEIAAASREQSQGIDQINKAVSDMDKVTQQNAAHAEETSAAAVELSSQAGQMQEMVGRLLSLIGGREGAEKAGATAADAARAAAPRASKAAVKPEPAAARVKTAAAKSSGLKAEQLIPLDNEEFKDF
ncbi:MAG: methyl-accepting chemotaxis protein [Desulfobacterales bacterium]